MPPKADYWKYFNIVGVVAFCLVAQCKHPEVSLGPPPKPYFHIAWFKVTYAHPQLVPDAPQPSSYWAEDDPRSLAAHRGIICQMVLDFQPLSLVNNKGFVINTRQVAQGVMP